MKTLSLLLFSLLLFHSAFAQDTLHIHSKKIYTLSAKSKIYFFIPATNDQIDSVIVINSKAYYALIQDQDACATFMNVYELYKKRISEGDSKVQALIQGYEVIIQTKDSSYASLVKNYDALNIITSKSIQQSNTMLHICKSSLDSLNTSLNTIQQENTILKKDIKTMKKQHHIQKWSFAIIGVSIGILIGILLT